MVEPHKMWIKQCEAAQRIREDFGIEKALGYLIGEKLLKFIRIVDVDNDPDFEVELPYFVEEIKNIFDPQEIQRYFEKLRRVGALGHVLNDEDFEMFRAAGAIHEDPVSGAEDVLHVKRMKKLLLT